MAAFHDMSAGAREQSLQSDKEDSANTAQARHGCIHGARCLEAEEQGWQVEVRTTFLLYNVHAIHFLLLSGCGCTRRLRLVCMRVHEPTELRCYIMRMLIFSWLGDGVCSLRCSPQILC